MLSLSLSHGIQSNVVVWLFVFRACSSHLNVSSVDDYDMFLNSRLKGISNFVLLLSKKASCELNHIHYLVSVTSALDASEHVQ